MNAKKITLLVASAILGSTLHAGALLAFWDFNEEAITSPLVNTPFTFDPNAGAQPTAELSMVLADTGSSNTFGVLAEGTTENDLVNDPAVAGNAFSFSRGLRSNGATTSISFDATEITLPVEMSFAINRIDSNGVNAYQASYSIDGGDNFIDFGDSQSIAQGSWVIHTINFGTLLSGAEEAIVRLTYSGGVQNWSTSHRTNIDNIALTAIPEPGTLALVGIALGSLLLFRRRK
ncbi:MAG: PEP-CTERM sorting domain-containing protein [Verrucomicrobia bacterium]|nr:PEP-CTERM sorting domain-containing protein [Verrucomicrobiota bacterium]MCH8527505.1 PEP-CTERM sorting domain-containing protein [Kiritimatiellia bacterium]